MSGRKRAVRTLLTTLLVLTTGLPVAAQAGSTDTDGDGLQDAFEQQWGMSSADLADSDGDGLIDAAEDDDGDQLSALGEQRYGTDPGSSDSDGDGISDGDDDSDGDGRPDAAGQDQRPTPRGMRPSPDEAWWDRPDNYDDTCHGDQYDPALHPCVFGDEDSDIDIVLFGDSHALQWLPALVGAADEQGWRVTTLTKAACPPARILSGRKEDSAGQSCERWRPAALAWLAEQLPDVVLLAGGGRIYKHVEPSGERVSDEEGVARWMGGLQETLLALPATTTAVVLADTPFLDINPPTCLEEDASDLSACSTPREDAIDPAFDAQERQVTEEVGARYANLTSVVCPYSPCPVVVGDVLVWRNRDHITATFASLLTPSMRAVVADALAGSGTVADPDSSASAAPAVASPEVTTD